MHLPHQPPHQTNVLSVLYSATALPRSRRAHPPTAQGTCTFPATSCQQNCPRQIMLAGGLVVVSPKRPKCALGFHGVLPHAGKLMSRRLETSQAEGLGPRFFVVSLCGPRRERCVDEHRVDVCKDKGKHKLTAPGVCMAAQDDDTTY